MRDTVLPFRGWLITAVDNSDAGVTGCAVAPTWIQGATVLPVLSWTGVAVTGAELSAGGDVLSPVEMQAGAVWPGAGVTMSPSRRRRFAGGWAVLLVWMMPRDAN